MRQYVSEAGIPGAATAERARILAVVATLVAMLALAFAGDRPALRRSAVVGLLVVIPQAVALLTGMLVIGRSTLTATLERALLVSLTGWMLWTAFRSPPRDPAPPPAEHAWPPPATLAAAAGVVGTRVDPSVGTTDG